MAELQPDGERSRFHSIFLNRPAPAFLALALATFLISTTFADVFARVRISGENVGDALSESLYWSAVQFVGTIMLLAPFVVVALVAASVARRTRLTFGLIHLAIFFAIFGWMYFAAHQAAQVYMMKRMWTAAALSVGLLPFRIVPLVAIAFLARWLILKFEKGRSSRP